MKDNSEISSEYVRVEALVTNGPKVIAIGPGFRSQHDNKKLAKQISLICILTQYYEEFKTPLKGLELNRAISTKRKPKWSHIMFDMSKDHKG